jgi:hypothetical protein
VATKENTSRFMMGYESSDEILASGAVAPSAHRHKVEVTESNKVELFDSARALNS